MTRTGKGTLLAGAKGLLGLVATTVIVMGCGPGTPAPPRTADGSVDPTQVCAGPGIEYDSSHGQTATIAVIDGDSVRGEIIPEKRSHRIDRDSLETGRVIARVRLVTAGAYQPLGLSNTMPACWFVQGRYPDSLYGTIYGFDGTVLAPKAPIHPKHGLFVWHIFHAEAHWDPVKPKAAALDLDLRPPELRAEMPDSARRRETYARALLEIVAKAQGSCTKGGCCPQ
jgi:hypothetical protein